MNASDAAMLWAACSLYFFSYFGYGELNVSSESQYDLSEKYLVLGHHF